MLRSVVVKSTFILCLIFMAGGTVFAAGAATDDDKVAIVNKTVITRAQLQYGIGQAKQWYLRQGRSLTEEQIEKLKGFVLGNLISQELLYQASLKKGIVIDDAAVEKELEKLKVAFPDEAAFKNALEAMNTSFEQFKVSIQRVMAIKAVISSHIASQVVISPDAEKQFYADNPQFFRRPERIQASHILIKVDQEASAAEKSEALRKIEAIQIKLKAGEDFAILAKAHSQGPSGSNGGDLGFFKRGQMVKPFEDAAFALAPNAVSDIVKTQFGYHLIKLTQKQPQTVVAFEEAQQQISAFITQQEVQQKVRKWVEELRRAAEIEEFIG